MARIDAPIPGSGRAPKTRSEPASDRAPAPEAPAPKVPPGKSRVRKSPARKAAAGRTTSKGAVPPTPPFRVLRGYAFDPSLTGSLDTLDISAIAFHVPWEELKPGPVGEYVQVIDVDPASQCCYDPIDLEDRALLAQGGLPPSEGIPQFHQQMVYAVCSLTISNFERALGRRALWRPGKPAPGRNRKNDAEYQQHLRVYPHALREANAYYSPEKIALLFGYFNANSDDPGDHMPGGRVFTCLSHDVIAHETTHALLDGMHRRFLLPSNPDVHAFHEAFADCVALFQHFTFPEIVCHQIATTRGDIMNNENLLGQLATQFGHATGLRGALRDAIGSNVNGMWTPHKPDPEEYERTDEPHARGAFLVAAVFDAFLSIYRRRTADLLRLATGGSGILRAGAIPPDLVARLAGEAAKSAQHVLTMCIRALDYCPPTDITFGEYLRALITADYDLVQDDDLNYRVSFIEAFRRRGIFPRDVGTLSVESLRWRRPEDDDPQPSRLMEANLIQLRDVAGSQVYVTDREKTFILQRRMRRDLHEWLEWHLTRGAVGRSDARFLGLDPSSHFEVHTARFAHRTSPDGGISPQLIVGLLQETPKPVDTRDAGGPKMLFEGGCTIIADLRESKIRYCIRKDLQNAARLARQQEFAMGEFNTLRCTYLGARAMNPTPRPDEPGFTREPFAMIHRGQ